MNTNNQPKSKKPLLQLLKTTLIGGFIVVLPAYLGILVVNKMIKGILALIPAFLRPLAALLGISETSLGTPIALIIFILICFLAGIILQSNYATIFRNALEPFFKKIPGYLLIRSITKRMVKMEQAESYDVAFVALGETYQALTPALLIEKHDNGYYTIFFPSVPSPTIGNLYIVPEDRVFPVNVPFLDMVKFISRWGEASPALLEAIQHIEKTKSSKTINQNLEQSKPEDTTN